MRGRRGVNFWIAAMLTIALALPGLPAPAGGGASIRGTVLSATDQLPLRGMTIYAADTATGDIYPSSPTNEKGAFEIGELPGSTFELAVADDHHLYVVSPPLSLGPAGARQVNLAVTATAPSGNTPPSQEPTVAPRPRVWNNPLTASLIVVGSAIVVGALINAATDDEDDAASPITQN